jgi:hypothetical protein
MSAERTKPNLTLRVGIAATVGIVAQFLLLMLLAGALPMAFLPAFVFLPPSVLPTLCVVWTLGRSGVLFPGAHGLPIALALGSWHVAFFSCGLLRSIFDIKIEGWSGPMVVSLCGTIPIAIAIWRLVRQWDWGCAFWMLGAGAAIGGAATVTIDWATLMIIMTVLWTTAIGFIAGLWLAKAMAPR